MPIQTQSAFQMNAPIPLDNRSVVPSLAARAAIPASQRYDGMLVYVQANTTLYQLQGGIADINWNPISTGAASGNLSLLSGGQSFVDQTPMMQPTMTAGTPAAGSFYSGITGRAPMVDLTKDLRPSFGIERIFCQELFRMKSEFDQNNELPVYGVGGDTFNRIRFVGKDWNGLSGNTNYTSTGYGTGVWYPATTSGYNYIEVTFFGTGLNILMNPNGAVNGQTSIDGGSSTFFPTVAGTVPNLLALRYWNANLAFPIVSGLPLGVHTAKIAWSSTGVGSVSGFEILGNLSAITTNPGTAYVGGAAVVLGSQQTTAYNSVVTGTTGGRVVHYLNANGTVGQAFTPNATGVTSDGGGSFPVPHTNEEINATYLVREFGVGNGSDFSTINATARQAAHTLEDGVTSLSGVSVIGGILSPPSSGPVDGILTSAAGAVFYFTFTGTGFDVQGVWGPSSGFTYTLSGGIAAGGFTLASGAPIQYRVYNCCSGLPYGTYTVAITATGTGGLINGFRVYQPKKPAIPAGAMELADYFVPANYSFVNGFTPSVGILSRCVIREMVLGGTWTVQVPSGALSGQCFSGYYLNTAVANSIVSYKFYGTGIEVIGVTTGATVTVSLDGSSPAAASQISSSSSYNGGTGVWTPSTTNTPSKLAFTGLTLGYHNLVLIVSTVTSGFALAQMNVIQPTICAHKTYDTNLIATTTKLPAMNSLSDNRNLVPYAGGDAQAKNVQKCYNTGQAFTTALTTQPGSPVPDMIISHRSKTGRIRVSYHLNVINNTASVFQYAVPTVDGIAVGNQTQYQFYAASANGTLSGVDDILVQPGSINLIALHWWVSGGTSTAGFRYLHVEDV